MDIEIYEKYLSELQIPSSMDIDDIKKELEKMYQNELELFNIASTKDDDAEINFHNLRIKK